MLSRILRGKAAAGISVLLATTLISTSAGATSDFKQVKVEVNDRPVFFAYTSKGTVAELLADLNLVVGENDILLTNENEILVEGSVVEIRRNNKIFITDSGNTRQVLTDASSVRDLIENGIINIDETRDFIDVSASAPITDGMKIRVTRVTNETFDVESEIPFETHSHPNNTMFEGETAVVQEGVSGILVNKTEIVYHDGKEVERYLSEYILAEPIDEIVEYGTKVGVKTASGESLDVKKVLSVSASAYCACSACCGKSDGITASGMKAVYGVVAVDPRVIPLGTKLYIESSDGSYVYGHAVAADTGGAIKGNKVDLFYPSHSDALRFGRRSVNVYVLN